MKVIAPATSRSSSKSFFSNSRRIKSRIASDRFEYLRRLIRLSKLSSNSFSNEIPNLTISDMLYLSIINVTFVTQLPISVKQNMYHYYYMAKCYFSRQPLYFSSWYACARGSLHHVADD